MGEILGIGGGSVVCRLFWQHVHHIAWREFVHSYFARGKGWAYEPSDRTVVITVDGHVAWFDETVENRHFGACRGSGVLRLEGGEWRVAQYNLTIPVPDELVPELVEKIRGMRPA